MDYSIQAKFLISAVKLTLFFRVFLVAIILVTRPSVVISQPLLPLSVNPLARRESLFVSIGVDPASPELRYQELDYLLEGSRRSDVGDVKPIYISFADPLQYFGVKSVYIHLGTLYISVSIISKEITYPFHIISHRLRAPNPHMSKPTNRRLLSNRARRPARHVVPAPRRERVEDAAHLVLLERVRGRELLVDGDLGEVDAGPAADEHQAPDYRGVPRELLVLGARLLVGAPHDRRVRREELERLRIAPFGRRQLPDLLYFRPQQARRVRRHEDCLRVRGRELGPRWGRPRLEEEGRALRRGVHDVPRVQREVLPLVVDRADLVRVRVAVVFGIGRHCVVCP